MVAMPSISKKSYDLVSDDGYDSRIPLHNEEAFEHGITFQAKVRARNDCVSVGLLVCMFVVRFGFSGGVGDQGGVRKMCLAV